MIIYAVIARGDDGEFRMGNCHIESSSGNASLIILTTSFFFIPVAAVLVDCCDPLLKGNAPLVTSVLMEHLRDNPTLVEEGDLRTFVQRNADESLDYFSHFLDAACSMALGDDDVDENYFHLYLKGGIYYCCISDDQDSRDQKVNFAFLEHVEKEFRRLHKPNRIKDANAYSLDATFKPNVRDAMHHYNTNHKSLAREESVQNVMAKVQDLKEVMNRNINLLLERGNQLDELLDKSDLLQQDAKVFKKKSRVMLRQQSRRYYLRVVIIVCIVAVLSFLASIGICGVGYKYCRAKLNDGDSGN